MLLTRAKLYAAKNNTSLSGLIEEYFRKLVSRPSLKKESLLDMVDRLPEAKIDVDKISLDDYYEDKQMKYGY